MEKFVDSIKHKYQKRLINREKQWPPCHSNKLVNLELVERRKGESYLGNQPRGKGAENAKRTPLVYDQLFEGKKRIRRILVEGDAGIGKTTLSVSISEDWANGKLFQQFELVLLLPLRLKEIALAGTLGQLVKMLHSSSKICDAVVNYLDEEEGEKVLIIADGWDELSESSRAEDSFLYKLLFERFPFLSVIITSRPSGSAQLRNLPHIDRFVEIHGFDKENIKDYIQSEFIDNQIMAGELIRQLESNPLIESVCSIPLSCAIICHMWRITEETIPSNLTRLYTKIILNIVLRNIKKIEAFKDVKNLKGFADIPSGLEESWWLLCKFALHAMQKDQIVFSQKELDKFSQDLASNTNIFNCFGLLQSADSIVETGCEASFHFLHLTFQEYLAALYLVKQLKDVELADSENIVHVLKLYKLYTDVDRFSIVWRFFFGIFFCEIHGNNDFFVHLYLKLISVVTIDDELILYHCAFEANNKDIIRMLTEKRPSVQYMDSLTAHDCNAILYIIDNVQKHNGMNIDFDNCSVTENQIKALTNALADKQGELQVEWLSLGGNRSTDKVIANLHKVSAAFSSLWYLSLDNNQIGSQTIKSIVTSSISNLLILDLSHNPLGISGVQTLRDAVCSSALSNLSKLKLQASLSNHESTDQAFLEALSTNCPLLRVIDLSKNDLSSPSVAMALARVVPSESQIRSIIISETKLGNHGLNCFTKSLKEQCCISELQLKNNGISGNSLLCLADSIHLGTIKMKSLAGSVDDILDNPFKLFFTGSGVYLDDNPLGLKGSVAVGRILSSVHNQSTSLSLSKCQLTTVESSDNFGNNLQGILNQSLDLISDGTQSENWNVIMNVGQYLTQLPQNACITDLNMNGSRFSGEGIHILAGFLHLCPCLKLLDTEDCGIDSDGIEQLIKHLQAPKPSSFLSPCSKLEIWNLDNNNIDDRGILLLISHLSPLFPKLGGDGGPSGIMSSAVWDFRGNPVCNEVIKRFKEETYEKYYPDLGKVSSHDDGVEIERKAAEEFNIYDTTPVTMLAYDRVKRTKTVHEEEPNITVLEGSLIDESSVEIESLKEDSGSCTTVGSPLGQLAPVLPSVTAGKQTQTHITKDIDIDSLPGIEHHLLDLLKWEDESGTIREFKIYTKISHRWNRIATRLGFEFGEIDSIQRNPSFSDYERMTAMFKRWFENAVGLPNADKYPKSWQGLVNLLKDAELGEVATELHTALSSPRNSMRKNL